MTQAERLISHIRKARAKGLTYGEVNDLHISSCGWKRISEAGHRYLRAGETLAKRLGRDGLKRFVIVRARG